MTPLQQILLVLARILPISHTRAACQRPTVPVEHGRLHPRCDDSRSARSFLHHQLIRRWAVSPRRSDAPSRCLCYNLSWLLILSDSQRGSSLSPFVIGGGGAVGASSSPDSDRLPSNQSRDCSATVGAASISPGSHYTETARKRGSETEMKIEEKMRGEGKIG